MAPSRRTLRGTSVARRRARVDRRPTGSSRCARQALADPETFWGEVAAELPWFRRWDRVFEADPPSFRWFVGGRTNLAWNALDATCRAAAAAAPR